MTHNESNAVLTLTKANESLAALTASGEVVSPDCLGWLSLMANGIKAALEDITERQDRIVRLDPGDEFVPWKP
jgi:hypothetical protein